jgi:hypothetical protein
MFSADNLAAVMSCAADLPSANEAEARNNNTTRAEVFAGVLRAWRLLYAASTDSAHVAGT